MNDRTVTAAAAPRPFPAPDVVPGRRTVLLPDLAGAVDAVTVLVLTGLALFAFRSSYGGIEYLVVGLVAAVLGTLVAHAGHELGWPLVVTIAVAAAVYAVTAGALALGHYAIGGFVPSPRSVTEAFTSAVTGWKELLTTAPPAGSTGDLMVLPVAGGLVATVAGHTFARRLRRFWPLATVPPMALLGLGIAVGIDRPVSVVAHGAVFAVVVLGWLAWREHRRRPLLHGAGVQRRQLGAAAVVMAIAGVSGLAVAPWLPGAESGPREIWRQTVTPPFDPRRYPSPLNGYRDYVKLDRLADGDPEPAEVMFTIEGLPAGVPVRLATMDTYDGLVWQVSAGDPEAPSLNDSGSFERIGTSLAPDVDGELAEVVVTIGAYNDVWIPDVGEVVSLRFAGSADGPLRDRALADSFRYNRATDTAATVLRLAEGDRYEMTVRLPAVFDELAGELIDPDVARIGQAFAVPRIVEQLATPDLLAVNDTAERLDRVRELMATTGVYSDGDIGGGHIRAKAGHSAYRLTEFVDGYPRRPFIGNAEQYASAYALLFRELERLPTRVVMGFVPGAASIDRPVDVLSTDVEAWVEVPVAGVGWAGIFPTPPRDQLSVSATSAQQPEPDYRTQNPPPPPLIDPEFDQPARASGDAQAPDRDEPNAGDDGADPDGGSPVTDLITSRYAVLMAIVLSPFVLLGLVAGTIVCLKALRRSRRRRLGPNHRRVSNGWCEVTDYAVDCGRPVPATTTRREAAAFVASTHSVALAERTDAAVWSGSDLTEAEVDAYWEQLEATLASMRSELRWRQRVLARCSLRSLSRRRGIDEDGPDGALR